MASNSNDRRAIFTHLKTEPLAPIYLIQGNDTYMLDTAINSVVEKALPKGSDSFNLYKYEGAEVTPEEIINACQTVPMLSEKKVVIIRDIQNMPPNLLEEINSYFLSPCPFTVLIFHAYTAETSLDGRKKGVKALRQNSKEFELKAFYDYNLPEILEKEARKNGISLDSESVSYLITAVGTQLGDLYSALEKISLFLNAKPNSPQLTYATIAEVSKIIAETQTHSIFKLTEALGMKNIENACHILDTIIQAGEPALRILSIISRHFRILESLHDPQLRGLNDKDCAQAIGIEPYFFSNYRKDALRFSPKLCEFIHKQILETDYLLKSTSVPDKIIMEHLLFSICLNA